MSRDTLQGAGRPHARTQPRGLQRLAGLLPRFLSVGAAGFVVDASILTALVSGAGSGPYAARAVSFTVAVTLTWYLNRRWVFGRATMPITRREYAAYVTVQLTGALINLLVYAAAIHLVPPLGRTPVIPLAMGAAVALLFNFLASNYFVFADTTDRRDNEAPSR